jgi:uncharacterized protein YlxW (UPF0749 family)
VVICRCTQAAEAEKKLDAQTRRAAELQRELAALQERSAAGATSVSALEGQLQSLRAAADSQATTAQKLVELSSNALAAVADIKTSVKHAGSRTAAVAV